MFDIEDDIIAQRDQMIEEARTKINRTFTETELFTIAGIQSPLVSLVHPM